MNLPINIYTSSLKIRDHFENLSADGRVILKWILEI
jgi:hypothetical protein